MQIAAVIGGICLAAWGINEAGRRSADERIKALPRSQWPDEIARRDSWICGICGKKIKSFKDLEIDHIQPVSLGGRDDPSNLRATHWWCNASRSNKYKLKDKITKFSREF